MEQSSTDRRVRKTKKQLRLALMELLAEKSAKSISVRELTERADINRGTFYIHYRDVGDLLQRLEDEMADRLTALCKDHKPEDSTWEQFPFLRDLYRFILDNADLCRVLLGPNGDIAYTNRICCILRDCFLYDFLSQFYPGDRQRLNHFCSFIVSGNLNLALSCGTGGRSRRMRWPVWRAVSSWAASAPWVRQVCNRPGIPCSCL